MDAVFGQLRRVARHILVFHVVLRVEGLLTPVQDHFQLVDTAGDGLHLVVGVPVEAGAGVRVGVGGVPDEIGHDGLILSAGDQRIAAYFRVFLDEEHGVAVLGGLGCGGNARAARAEDYNVIGDLNRVAGHGLQRVGDERGLIRDAGGVCGGVDGLFQGAAGERRAGDGVHAGAVGLDDLGQEQVIGHGAHVLRLAAGCDFDAGDGVLVEGDGDLYGAVIAFGGAGIGACGEG